MLSLERVKRHLRLEQCDTDEDELIQGYANAALSAFETWTNRRIVEEVDEESPANAILMTPAVAQGALLLIGQWYTSREAVGEGALVELPMATSALWQPHRWVNV